MHQQSVTKHEINDVPNFNFKY